MKRFAEAIYGELFSRPSLVDPLISYTDLLSQLSAPLHVNPRSPELSEALLEIVEACQRKDLAVLPALVINSQLGRPDPGYFIAMGQDDLTEEEQIREWRAEVERVKPTSYPFDLSS